MVGVTTEYQVMATLEDNVAAYEGMREELETNHMHQWVVIYDEELVGSFPDFQEAAHSAVTRFGPGPYHIKKVGEPPLQIATLWRSVQTRGAD